MIYGNVGNNGFITSLPDGCAVEVPCLVDDTGIQPTYRRRHPAAAHRAHAHQHQRPGPDRAALLTENPEHIYHAAMLDPHTAAELDLDQIWNLTDDLLAAHGDWLPGLGPRSTERRKAGCTPTEIAREDRPMTPVQSRHHRRRLASASPRR